MMPPLASARRGRENVAATERSPTAGEKLAMQPGQTFQFNLAETFPHLEHAPIEEAVIQWVARAETTLTPDELRQQLAERLPDYPDCHHPAD